MKFGLKPKSCGENKNPKLSFEVLSRAEDEARTRDNQLGRLELYQLSYFRLCECKYRQIVFFVANFFSKKLSKS